MPRQTPQPQTKTCASDRSRYCISEWHLLNSVPSRCAQIDYKESKVLTAVDLESGGIEKSAIEQSLESGLVKGVGGLVDREVCHI